jgi:hypothetical protein
MAFLFLHIETGTITGRPKKGRRYVNRVVSFAHTGGHCAGRRPDPRGNSYLPGQKVESCSGRKTDSLNHLPPVADADTGYRLKSSLSRPGIN